MQNGMREARKLGLDFVLAKGAGVGVHRRLGFEVVREFVQVDSVYGGRGGCILL